MLEVVTKVALDFYRFIVKEFKYGSEAGTIAYIFFNYF